ncbi:MAG: ORF6N domain-containing protein [Bacteroidales bacterium]|nr:ORF6N domain-containing protein [Bacteroidales bacterium]
MIRKGTEIVLSQQIIESKIFTIRGVQVVMDKDLASFYEVKPIRLREQVKRNANRFPEDFLFQLNDKEVDTLVSQNAIPSKQALGGYLPYAFTEQGVAAVSAVLKSNKAAEVSIMIMRAFVAMRKFIIQNARLFERLDRIEIRQLDTDRKFDEIFKALESKQIQPDKGIFFDGQVFDAWLFISDLLKSAQTSLILIDNYVDETVLSLFSKKNQGVTVTIYTKALGRALQEDANKFNAQFGGLTLHAFDTAHDRFLLIDKTEVYHIGASLKDLGKKWFAFSKMEKDSFVIFEKLGI